MSNFFDNLLTNIENSIVQALPGLNNGLPGTTGNTSGVIPIVPTYNKATGTWGYPNTNMPTGSNVPATPASLGSIVPIAPGSNPQLPTVSPNGSPGGTTNTTATPGILGPLIDWLNAQKTSVTNSLLGAEKSAVNTGKTVGIYLLFAIIFIVLIVVFVSSTDAGKTVIEAGKNTFKNAALAA
jgi:hypothetical protein